VHTHVKFRDPDAKKYVSVDGSGTETSMAVDYTKPYTYRLDFQVPDTKDKLDKLVLSDAIEPVQTVQSVKVVDDLTGKDITDQGKLNINKDTQAVDWTADKPDTFHGKLLHKYVTVLLKNTPDLLKYLNKETGKIEVPNHGTMDYGDKPIDTPPTKVTPPEDPGSVTKKIEIGADTSVRIEDINKAITALKAGAEKAAETAKTEKTK
jgi:hypothetical protein